MAKKYTASPAKSAYSKASYKDHQLVPVNPLKEQFVPTPAEPVHQHKRMAGCA